MTTTMTKLERLTATLADDPMDATAWRAYGTYCRDVGQLEWADLADRARAIPSEVARILFCGMHAADWPLGDEIATACLERE